MGFQIEFKEGRLTKWKDSTQKNLPKNPSGIYTIEKLKPLKVYLVRARSRNLAGLSEPSNVVYLQTNRTFKPLGRGGRGYPYRVGDLKGAGNAVTSFSTNLLMSFTTVFCLFATSSLYIYHLKVSSSL